MSLTLRTLTYGFELNNDKQKIEKDINNFFDKSLDLFNKSQYDVRTTRLNLPLLNKNNDFKDIDSVVKWLSVFSEKSNIRWICAPFNTFDQDLRGLNNLILEIVKRYKNVFINYLLAENGKINNNGIIYGAKLIKSISALSNSGYDNFRFGNSFNCNPNTPFFPFTYQKGSNGFSISLELIPLLMNILNENKSKNLDFLRNQIIKTIKPKLEKLNEKCLSIEKISGIEYYGIDLSLAPHPENDNNSVAALIERFGLDTFGSSGTLFFTGYLTNILKSLIISSGIRSVGFNGVMFSLLEDTRLGINNNTKEFSIDSLMSYSTVCGCGIDMVPIPGDCFEEEIASLMLDIATISCLLKKPLGVRLLPIPMKKNNEFTEFSHDFLHNSRIKTLKYKGCYNRVFNDNNSLNFL